MIKDVIKQKTKGTNDNGEHNLFITAKPNKKCK